MPTYFNSHAYRAATWLAAVALAVLALGSSEGRAQNIISLPSLFLESNDTLPALIGGLTPGTEHDQYQIDTDALLDGRLDLILINGFQPQPGDQIRLIDAAVVSGGFDSHFFPTALPSGVAVEFMQTNKSFDVLFSAATLGPQFISPNTTSVWTVGDNWLGQSAPASTDIIDLANSLPVGNQLVQVFSGASGPGGPATAHQLTVRGTSTGQMTLRVNAQAGLSATERLTVAGRGRVHILGGVVATSEAIIQQDGIIAIDGGQLVTGARGAVVEGALFGNGVVIGDLAALEGGQIHPGSETVNPIGLLEVMGDYTQKSGASLNIDIIREIRDGFDEVAVQGVADIQGELLANFQQASIGLGDEFVFFTANQISPFSRFERIESAGLPPGVYAAPKYTSSQISLLLSSVGDMNADGIYDAADIDLFELALRSREDYFNFDDGSGPLGIEADISGDTDFDGDMDFDDIDDLIALLPAAVAVIAREQLLGISTPEPSSALLLAAAAVGCLPRRLRNRSGCCLSSRGTP